MATWAIGDVQGCLVTLQRLLAVLRFEPGRDQLWFVGDLVNRGPASVGVLRFVRGLGASAITVLGNHDIHLLARAAGHPAKERDTLDSVLNAPDRDELLDWLRERPLLHEGPGGVEAAPPDGSTRMLVHAGFPPSWSIDDVRRFARDGEARLRQPDWRSAVLTLRHPRATDLDSLAIGTLTRIRMLDEQGLPSDYSGPLEGAPRNLKPWWEGSRIVSAARTAIVGHWAALGLRRLPGVLAIDTGCIWGRTLTAVKLDDGTVASQVFADQSPRKAKGHFS